MRALSRAGSAPGTKARRAVTPPIGFGRQEWAAALEGLQALPQAPPPRPRYPADWWDRAFRNPPTPSERSGHPCGEREMLMIVAYDITDARRLAHVAKHCEEYGVRVQYSVFECRLPRDVFDAFWEELKALIDPKQDRLVAYRICTACAGEIRSAGTMETTTNDHGFVAYIF